MPSTVASVMGAAGLEPEEVVRWGERIPEATGRPQSGFYVVSLTTATNARRGMLAEAPVSVTAIREWLTRRPELLLDGTRPTPKQLAAAVARLWLPDEVVLYIGIGSGSLAHRVSGYYTTALGNRSPHAGGRYLKALACLNELHVHDVFHDAPKPVLEDLEATMIGAFIEPVSRPTRRRLRDPERPLPFANSRWEPRNPVTGRRLRHEGPWTQERHRAPCAARARPALPKPLKKISSRGISGVGSNKEASHVA